MDPELDALWGSETEGRRYTARIVVEYTCPDGTTGRLESPPFIQCGGTYARFANSPAARYDAENKLLVVEVALDLSLVEAENVSFLEGGVFSYVTWDYLDPLTLSSSYAAPDGSWRLVFTTPMETLVPGDYYTYVELHYDIGYGPVWEVDHLIDFTLN